MAGWLTGWAMNGQKKRRRRNENKLRSLESDQNGREKMRIKERKFALHKIKGKRNVN